MTRTGRIAWSFYTVPGNPSKPVRDKARSRREDWHGDWWRKVAADTSGDADLDDPQANWLFGVGNGLKAAAPGAVPRKGEPCSVVDRGDSMRTPEP